VNGAGGADFFGATPFSKDGETWKGGKYWPLEVATVNFLAIANANANNTTGVTWDGTHPASQVVVVMSDNHSEQRDLMYAIGAGSVTKPSSTLVFPTSVTMPFQHAQAWMDFKVKANSSTEEAITINSITLKGAKYAGTYTITHTDYNLTTGHTVAGAWTALGGAQNVVVPNWTADALTTDFVQVGNGLLIVPDDNDGTADWSTFVINYTLDGITYDYEYTPSASAANVDQAKHYVFNITFKLHEIEIAPTVTAWTDGSTTAVTIPEE